MIRDLLATVLLAVALCFLNGCGVSARQIQAQTATAVANSANASLPILVGRYRLEGDRAIAEATDRAGAEAAVAAVQQKWTPVWKSWETLRLAHGAWAALLEKGDVGLAAALSALGDAYCGLLKVWPGDVPAIPLSVVRCEP